MTSAALPYPHDDERSLPDAAAIGHPPGWWGMVWLCATEGMLFACLIATFFFLRGTVESFSAEGGQYPALALPLSMTAMLLASSATMRWGERGIERGDQARLRAGLAITFVLGAAFLALQATEFRRNPLGPTVSAYHSIFYTTTSLHGAHVAFGLLMNLYVQLRAWRGHFAAKRCLAVQNAALYWHFVDAVWIMIITSFYLAPRLW